MTAFTRPRKDRKLNDAVVEGPAATGDVLAVRQQEEG